MKKKLSAILTLLVLSLSLCGCTEQYMAREFGGSMKLEEITWKDDDTLWYLTRPMREDEEAETHVFQASSAWGVFEGTVTVIEKKED